MIKKGSRLICPNPECRDEIAEWIKEPRLDQAMGPEFVKGLQGTEDLTTLSMNCQKCGDRIDLPNWGEEIPYVFDPKNWREKQDEQTSC